jgi:lipopolysaccharide transport system ATP-binding protein
MTPIVRFTHVSKLYRLGVSRVGVPTAIADGCRRLLARGSRPTPRNQTVWALRDVTFELEPGECLALVGPNGAGKTTILKLLSLITKPTEGTIHTQGRLSALLELGAGFHPDLTGRENIYLNAAILGLSRYHIRRRFDEIVAFSELEDFIDTPVKRYSSGMAVRLGFSVAACIQPEILLIDEVLAVGDAAFSQKCLKRIHYLIENGTAIIFVSHNMYMVKAICNRALYLRHGQVHAAGGAREAIDAYERDVHQDRAAQAGHAASELSKAPSDITIDEVKLCGQPAAGDNAVLSSGPATITIRYRSALETGPVNLSLFIRRSDGLTCCMMRTSSNGHRIALRPGPGTISVYLERLQLITGTYAVHAYFLNESDSLSLTPAGAQSDWFLVKGTALSSADDSGVYEPLVKWSAE